MDENIKSKLKEYISKYRNNAIDLDKWVKMKGKEFTTMMALEAVYNSANGRPIEMNNIIKMLNKSKETYGRRGHVYNDVSNSSIDINYNNGVLSVIGYKGVVNEPQTNNISPSNPNIFRKSDGATKMPYRKTSEEIHKIGKFVRMYFPNSSNDTISDKIKAIMDYGQKQKISYDKVMDKIRNGILTMNGYNDNYRVVPKNNFRESKKIIVGENAIKIFESIEKDVTFYSFLSNTKSFLKDLLNNPLTAKPSIELICKGLNRGKLLSLLLNKGIIQKNENIVDEDEDGNPKTAVMNVKYKVPKKNFDRNMQKLFIKIFEKNVPENQHTIVNDLNLDSIKDNYSPSVGVTEDGEGATNCSSSGQFSQPLFGVQKREIYNTKPNEDIEEATTTTNSGNYQYTVPFPGDKATLKRKNGKDGSISINRIK